MQKQTSLNSSTATSSKRLANLPSKLLGKLLSVSAALLLAACSSGDPAAEVAGKALAKLQPTKGNSATGTVAFAGRTDGVDMKISIQGLTPGKHGFHIHENGDCSSGDGKSAGGHFAPDGNAHGSPADEKRHEGDLGNVVANDKGVVSLNLTDKQLALHGPNSIIGKAIIVHAGADDLQSQPSGSAGPRVACGVIEAE